MPATVIPVTGLNLGPVGSVSQSDFPLRTPRQVNPSDVYSIAFGEPLVLNANNTYSSVKQYVLGGDFVVSQTGTIAGNALSTLTLVSATGVATGQVVSGPGITLGTTITLSGNVATLSTPASGAETGQVFSFYTPGATLVSGSHIGIAAANTRTNPTFSMIGSQGAITPGGAYVPGSVCDALVQGTINVQVNNGTPTADGSVYIRVAANALLPNTVIGGIEAVVDPNTSSNTILITNLRFKTGVIGSDGTAQVTVHRAIS